MMRSLTGDLSGRSCSARSTDCCWLSQIRVKVIVSSKLISVNGIIIIINVITIIISAPRNSVKLMPMSTLEIAINIKSKQSSCMYVHGNIATMMEFLKAVTSIAIVFEMVVPLIYNVGQMQNFLRARL